MPDKVATVTSAPSRRRPVASMIGTTAAVAADIQALIAWSASGSVRMTASGISPRSAAATPRGSRSREIPGRQSEHLELRLLEHGRRCAAFGGSILTPMPVASAIVSGASEAASVSSATNIACPRAVASSGSTSSRMRGEPSASAFSIRSKRAVALPSPRRATRITSKGCCRAASPAAWISTMAAETLAPRRISSRHRAVDAAASDATTSTRATALLLAVCKPCSTWPFGHLFFVRRPGLARLTAVFGLPAECHGEFRRSLQGSVNGR